jgi:hypothetical protein
MIETQVLFIQKRLLRNPIIALEKDTLTAPLRSPAITGS